MYLPSQLPGLPVFYSTRDGHACLIAERIAARLIAAGMDAQAVNAAAFPPAPEAMIRLPIFVLIAAVRYGRHMRDAERALKVYARLQDKPLLALASVNLTARKPHKRSAETNVYLRKWIRKWKLSPDLALAIAGRLDYPHYRLFDRLAIQFIMTLTGGETDPAAQITYTDWNSVDAFADAILDRARTRSKIIA
jgi:menaquinone-dependent protoporphyrinogen oxidase